MQIFQSTLPVWGATLSLSRLHGIAGISIHAPRVGSDDIINALIEQGVISIHAPRVGSDQRRTVQLNYAVLFQSTLPVWGATLSPRYLA